MPSTLDTQDWAAIMDQLARSELRQPPRPASRQPTIVEADPRAVGWMPERLPGERLRIAGQGDVSEPDLLADAMLALWTGSSAQLLSELPPEVVRAVSRLADVVKRSHSALRPKTSSASQPALPTLSSTLESPYPDPELDSLRNEAMKQLGPKPKASDLWDPQVPLEDVPRAGTDMPDAGRFSVPGSAQRDLGELFDIRQRRGDEMDLPSWYERLKEYLNYGMDRPNIDTPSGPQPDIPTPKGAEPPSPGALDDPRWRKQIDALRRTTDDINASPPSKPPSSSADMQIDIPPKDILNGAPRLEGLPNPYDDQDVLGYWIEEYKKAITSDERERILAKIREILGDWSQ